MRDKSAQKSVYCKFNAIIDHTQRNPSKAEPYQGYLKKIYNDLGTKLLQNTLEKNNNK